MQLPFLKKNKLPRIAAPMDEKSVGFDADDKLEEHCFQELKDACQSHDVKAFRAALEAIVMNCFEDVHGPNDEAI